MQLLRSSPDPGLLHVKIKGKILNLYGLYSAVIVFAFAALVIPFIAVSSLIGDLFGGKSVIASLLLTIFNQLIQFYCFRGGEQLIG